MLSPLLKTYPWPLCHQGPQLLMTPPLLNRPARTVGVTGAPSLPTVLPTESSYVLRACQESAAGPTFLRHLNILHSIQNSRKIHCLSFSKGKVRLLITYNSVLLLIVLSFKTVYFKTIIN